MSSSFDDVRMMYLVTVLVFENKTTEEQKGEDRKKR